VGKVPQQIETGVVPLFDLSSPVEFFDNARENLTLLLLPRGCAISTGVTGGWRIHHNASNL
jgi:hypothetical protein